MITALAAASGQRLTISGEQIGWLCFGLGLFMGATITTVIVTLRRIFKEDNPRR